MELWKEKEMSGMGAPFSPKGPILTSVHKGLSSLKSPAAQMVIVTLSELHPKLTILDAYYSQVYSMVIQTQSYMKCLTLFPDGS